MLVGPDGSSPFGSAFSIVGYSMVEAHIQDLRNIIFLFFFCHATYKRSSTILFFLMSSYVIISKLSSHVTFICCYLIRRNNQLIYFEVKLTCSSCFLHFFRVLGIEFLIYRLLNPLVIGVLDKDTDSSYFLFLYRQGYL